VAAGRRGMTAVRPDKKAALAGHFLLRHLRPEELRRLMASAEHVS
jgi:hypothetical protein